MNRDQLKKYLHLNPEEKVKFKKELTEDTFLSEALEGLEKVDIGVIRNMDKRYFKNRFVLNFSLSIIMLFAFGLGIFWLNTSLKTNENFSKKYVSNSTVSEVEMIRNKQSFTKDTIFIPDLLISSNTLRMEHKNQRQIIITPKNSVDHIETVENVVNQEPRTLVELKIKKPNSLYIAPRVNKGRETYIQDLLVLDYRYYRKKPKIKLNPILNGVPASQEVQASKNQLNEELAISYVNFLSKTLKLFNESKFDLAIKRFDVILDAFPDDINAMFYQSICYYNLKDYSKAIKTLKNLETAFFTNFKEDQEWYLMLCYKLSFDEDNFQNQKNKIIERRGYYYSKSQKLFFNYP